MATLVLKVWDPRTGNPSSGSTRILTPVDFQGYEEFTAARERFEGDIVAGMLMGQWGERVVTLQDADGTFLIEYLVHSEEEATALDNVSAHMMFLEVYVRLIAGHAPGFLKDVDFLLSEWTRKRVDQE